MRHSNEGGYDGCGAREEFASGCSDNAQRSFGADEQIAQIVTGIVLAQSAQPFHDLAVGQYDFKAQDEISSHAVTQNGSAAGIGRKIAAQLTSAFRAQAQREQTISGFGG